MKSPPGDPRELASFDETVVHLHQAGKVAGTSVCGQTGVQTAYKNITCPLCAQVRLEQQAAKTELQRKQRKRREDIARNSRNARKRRTANNKELCRSIWLTGEQVDGLKLLAAAHHDGSVSAMLRRIVKGYLDDRAGEVTRLRLIAEPALEAARDLAIASAEVTPDNRAGKRTRRLRDLLRRALRDNT